MFKVLKDLFRPRKDRPTAQAAGPRVLVVGPAFLRDMAARAFEAAGWDVARCADAAAAVELAPLHRPECVLYFPSSATTADNAQLRAAAGEASVVFGAPAHTSASDLAAVAEECEAVGLVLMPFNVETLLEEVGRAHSRSKEEAAPWRASLATDTGAGR